MLFIILESLNPTESSHLRCKEETAKVAIIRLPVVGYLVVVVVAGYLGVVVVGYLVVVGYQGVVVVVVSPG